MSGPDISVQLYSVRDAIAADLPGALRRVAGIGFENVELYGFVDAVDDYRAALDATGLAATSAHARLVRVDDVDRVVDAAVALGVRTLIDPAVGEERWGTRADVEKVAAELNAVAERAADRGVVVGYHNHWWELESSIGGRPALEVLADALAPGVVLEVDTYWAEVGGVPAADLLRRLGDRVTHLHVKDGPVSRDTMAQLPAGRGVVPVVEILAAAPSAVRVVEFDDYDGDIFAGLTESLAFLRGQS